MQFPYGYRPGQKELISFIQSSLEDRMRPVVEAGTGTGKTVSSLAAAIPVAEQNGLKILYLTRTKSQQKQVIRECTALRAPCIAMQGRSSSTCPLMRDNQELASGTPDEISKLCSELKRKAEGGEGCQFFNGMVGAEVDHWLNVIREHPEPEDFAAVCEDAGICPYEMTKRLLPYMTVIAAAYPFAFLPNLLRKMSDWIGTPEDRLIIIVDEAHNLPDYLREIQTFEYSRYSIEMAEKEVLKEGDRELSNGLKITDISSVLKEVLDATLSEYLIDDDGLIPMGFVEQELMARLSLTSVDIERAAEELEAVGDIIVEKKKQSIKLPRSYIGNLGTFIRLWMSEQDIGSVRLVIGGDNPCFQSYSMDPRPAARPLNECFSALVMSGTLNPLDDFVKELGIQRAVTRRFPSPFPSGNLLTLYSDKVSMRYEDRSVEDNRRMISDLLVDTVRSAHVNTAVFFPSYEIMGRMVSEGIVERLGREVLYEHRGMPQSELMDTFDRFRTSEGSVLFAVTGGRISEGLDFPDKSLELAVLVGVPFAKPTARSRAMVHYYDARFGDGRRYVVLVPAQRKMKQSIGRLIRSETDRGVAVVLDRRAASMGLDALPSSNIPSAVSAFFEHNPY